MSDFDSDRVGFVVKYCDEYRILNGNEIVIIVFKFLLDLVKSVIK